MMAAITAAERGCRVVLLEKNQAPGRKLLITGNGRCNLTNSADNDAVLKKVLRNPRFLIRAFRDFSSRDTMRFFSDAGLALTEEDNGRIFPASGRAADVLAVLTGKMDVLGVRVMTGASVSDLLVDSTKPAVKGVRLSSGAELEADVTVIACGGKAAPSTGSSGDGARLAAQVGHRIIEMSPALVPLKTERDVFAELQGVVLKDVRLTAGRIRVRGDILFTHFGISGPAVLELSSRISGPESEVIADLLPDVTEEVLDKQFMDMFGKNGKRLITGILTDSGQDLPERFLKTAVNFADIPGDRRGSDVKKEERRRLTAVLKRLEIQVCGTAGFDQAMITRGGVDVKEIDPATMSSKIIDGLRFAGEVIDVDALTGGYNLQIAWATGHSAGKI